VTAHVATQAIAARPSTNLLDSVGSAWHATPFAT
jgi:hypothetical protein